ncbi:LTA synthase family protein [Capnocytophaga canis]|uniref:LTA synthase family protein n=1 Tax=Capnocytophaga canis TaxID=1848903 RepID=UPI00385EFDFB
MKNIRLKEYKILFYRLFLVYLFYFFARVCFYLFNKDLISVANVSEFFRLAFYGLLFDSAAIIYINLLFLLLSLFPLWVNTSKKYQNFVFWVYFLTNIPPFLLNFIDVVFFEYNRSRLTLSAWSLAASEDNKWSLLFGFLVRHWSVFVIFLVCVFTWIYLYKKNKIKPQTYSNKWSYFIGSTVFMFAITPLFLLGIRGMPFKKGTIPLTITDANKFANDLSQVNLILNTPFGIIRTLGKSDSFRTYNFATEDYIAENIRPIKKYNRKVTKKPNIVLFILEGMGNEYFETFNKDKAIPEFKSYTPFLDSLAQNGLYFTNVYANASRSMEGISAITAGIPTFETPLAYSPHSQQEIASIANIYREMNYKTAFFHGATNGSMGFSGFTKQIGFEHYFGRTEFNDESQHNGSWGIHDEPFLQYTKKEIDKMKTPFLATVFTLSSHEPYTIPEKYKGVFNKGDVPMQNAVAYSDYSIRKFFESAKKSDWFENTIFVFVADHPSTAYYDYYKQKISYFNVPIIFYSPSKELIQTGTSDELAQQIDIFPTLVDLAGYQKPFRSWGRSLFAKEEPHRAYVTNRNFYQLIQGDYIYVADIKGEIVGIYAKNDQNLKENLKEILPEETTHKGITDLRAFMQDFMDRILHQKLK